MKLWQLFRTIIFVNFIFSIKISTNFVKPRHVIMINYAFESICSERLLEGVTDAAMWSADEESRIHYITRCEPNFIIWVLFFHFTKSQIIKFGGGSEMRLPELPA